ncbi:hypothetical protein ACJX0J_017050, partial [Zea mays]
GGGRGGYRQRRPGGGGLRGVRHLPRQDSAPGDGPRQGLRPRLLCDLYFEVGILQGEPSLPTVQASIRIPQRAPLSRRL